MTEFRPSTTLMRELRDNLSRVMRENRSLREEVATKDNTIRILEDKLVEVQRALAKVQARHDDHWCGQGVSGGETHGWDRRHCAGAGN
jgi:hypothetical protein